MAISAARYRKKQAFKIEDPDEAKKELGWALGSESRYRIDSALELAKSQTDLADGGENWDSDPWLLGTAYGVVDLRNGELRRGQPSDRISLHTEVKFDPTAACVLWLRFLTEVFNGDQDLIDYIHRAVGYSLSGSTREECLFILWGAGRNGKGTFIKTLASALGDYAGTADFSTFVQKRNDTGPRDDIANMRGKRFVSAQEMRQGAAFAESLIKWLTGGDRVRARRLWENSSEFDPTHKIWLASNYKPVIRGRDPAIWSRVKLIPFTVSFEGRENKGLKRQLLEELPGILAWAVRGCLEWQGRGLGMPPALREAIEEYRQESDTLAEFINDCCSVAPQAMVRSGELWAAYLAWTKANEVQPASRTEFAKDLQRHDFEPATVGHEKTRAWKGLKLRKGEGASLVFPESENWEDDLLETGPVCSPTGTGRG